MKSHGFWKNIITESSIKEANSLCKDFINTRNEKANYYGDIQEKINGLTRIISEQVTINVKDLLCTDSISLDTVELHLQALGCEAIPHHQDNFYHCTEYNKSLKVLIPLNQLNINNGGLIFLDTEVNFPVLKHEASSVRNFSSYIPIQEINKLNFSSTEYEYNIGDASYHFINSIHFSKGNKTNNDSLFLVFRYSSIGSKLDKNAQQKYEECYKKHLSKLKQSG